MKVKDPEEEMLGTEGIKSGLKKENRLYRTALDHEITEITDEAKKIGKVALIAGGALLGTYLLVKLIKNVRKDPEEKEHDGKHKNFLEVPKTQVVVEKTKTESKFLSVIMEQLALVAVGILQEKIADLTNTDKKKLEDRKNELLKGNSGK